ncbi:50S ribosomal protein L10 [Candidatus Korarchaeum cryptofilum]|jgi:large subunit ribosomal protein L10|uniref:Large ribosomal subunit protein uL10 n=1 Tax=Candidatus Korarchaeum cryptofilum TaxID=498846 RepID=A0A429G3V9_9CREN|nr:50S ribosomal protein L10 [Candidatus Korarchaeum cryptofilum]RSN68439.1 50S ribosomal protein L10 [Candidatus Korarchaeum cryptofilum]
MALETVRRSSARIRKEEAINKFLKLLKEYPTVMIGDFSRIPANHFERVRRELSPDVKFFVMKKTLFKKACELSNREGLKKLSEMVPQSLVVIFSRKDPFDTYKLLSERKTEIFMKPGDVAEEDVVIPAGPTDLAPGPILMDLRAMNIPTKIQGGKVAIAESVTILKKGQKASAQIADLLRALNIKPLKVGFKVTGAIDESGLIYSPEVLSVTREDILRLLQEAHMRSLNLAIELGEINRHTLAPMMQRAAARAIALSMRLNWVSDLTIPLLLRKAVQLAKLLNEKIGG